MAMLTKDDKPCEQPVTAGSRQAVEAAIDASKLAEDQTWEQAAQKSRSVPPWHGGECKTKKPAEK